MITIKSDKFERENKNVLTSVFVITDEFPQPFARDDKVYKFISKLANKHKAIRVNLPISYHNTSNKKERSIKISFKNVADKNGFITDLEASAVLADQTLSIWLRVFFIFLI